MKRCCDIRFTSGAVMCFGLELPFDKSFPVQNRIKPQLPRDAFFDQFEDRRLDDFRFVTRQRKLKEA
jgi:hypothetical protein